MDTPASLTAMVIEDDGFQRRTIIRMLRTLGVGDVRDAKNGKMALELLAGGTAVDLAVCDLDMPEMDGMELLRLLGHAKSKMSVIIASAQDRSLLSSVDTMARAYGVNLLGVIEKPVTLRELADLIALHQTPAESPPTSVAKSLRFSLEQILHGIRENEIEPYFQPKVALATGSILGAEALARWHHPEHGLVTPDAFIAQLEQSGNIYGLTVLMLEKAAIACNAWRTLGMDMTVSVNLSLASLSDTKLADELTRIVNATGLDPHHVILEITESAAMTSVAPALENLARLRMHGFGLSIDDYGTGFSSLQQLTRVPFTELKIDQGFVKDCTANPSSRTIVESSVEMARRLGIKSIAEGVESQQQWDLLKASGSDAAQGYFIGKPMSQSAFLAYCGSEGRHFLVIHREPPRLTATTRTEHLWE